MKKRLFSFLLAICMLVSVVPVSVFAAHDSTGRPLDLTGDVYLALYIGGTEFPGEPAEWAVSGYLNLNSEFESPGFGIYADSAEGILKEQILDDVVQGTSGVWGVFSTTGGSKYLDPADGIVNEDGSHNAQVEEKIIQTAIDNGVFSLGAGESIDDYTIIWYVIKYQRSDSAWHIDGLITKKTTYSVNYYGNGNTSGSAPSGLSDIEPGSSYTILGNTGNLRKVVGNDTYLFTGWNTKTDGTGTHYEAGDEITVDENITLYAEWYLQNKYTATYAILVDGVETNITDIKGKDVTVWAYLDGQDAENATYIELEKQTTGVYSAQVTENGTYLIYLIDEDGNIVHVHEHQIVIYNQNGRTECNHYSVNYDANAGDDAVTWSLGAAPEKGIYHVTQTVIDGGNIPQREGYTFQYWLDQKGNIFYPGDTITESIAEKTVLTAQWEENIDVTVNITLDHKAATGGSNGKADKHDVALTFLQYVNDSNLPLQEIRFDENSVSWSYDAQNNVTTYSYVFTNLPKGHYHATAAKSHYELTSTHSGEHDADQTIDLLLTYAPTNFDLNFDVVIADFENQPAHLIPQAVNVKVVCWGERDGDLAWRTISQHEGVGVPVTVAIDETGKGTGYFPVWKYWPDGDGTVPYVYRVEVVSFVMPDGNVVHASGDLVTYRPNDAGLYTAVVTMEPDGRGDTGKLPTYPEGSNTTLSGAFFDDSDDEQSGRPTVTVSINPYTVTFDAGQGTLDGQQTVVLQDQYAYPELRNYTAVPNAAEDYFTGWFDSEGNPAANQIGQYLTQDVTYYAQYSVPMAVEGTVTVAGTYLQDGKIVAINPIDRAAEVMVILQKDVNGNWIDVASQILSISYDDTQPLGVDGLGTYRFENVVNDGAVYRISVLANNYDCTYDNESDPEKDYTDDKYLAVLGDDNVAVVDAHLDLAPALYEQKMEVDSSQISESFRPDSALAEILYRDLGDIHHYNVIAQHVTEPYGETIVQAANGKGSGSYEVWKSHTDGSLYEYQMNITKLYGNVDGVFDPDGTPYNSDTSAFTITYGAPSRYSAVVGGQTQTLKAVLVPKTYEIIFDLGIGPEESVEGMDEYLTDGGTEEDYYSYAHTWSFEDSFMAFPYREGWVFEGWQSPNDGVLVTNHGYITVGAALAEDVVLTAKWRKLTDSAYTVRHLELNTDIPLHGAVTVEGVSVGTVNAVDEVLMIAGYEYAGAKIGDRLYSLNEEAVLTLSDDPAQNVLTIYYLPDGSDGYTDQVQSNLKLDKTAVLENNGTYTINMETYTLDNPVTTLIQQNTPLDIVLVLDQSGSIVQSGYLDELQAAVDNFVVQIADHGRHNEVDHRIALVGYAGNETEAPTSTDTSSYPIAGGTTSQWVNTGVFDSNGDFHPYTVTGFHYSPYNGTVEKDGTYYVYSEGEYMLLTYHEEYRHLITEEEARLAVLEGTKVYGYVYDSSNIGSFVELTRNTSGLWLYGDKQLYSAEEFFTYHQDVWTHRRDLDARQIHAYGTGSNYSCTDGHGALYTREETTDAQPELDIFYDALVPVSVGANGSGGTNYHLLDAANKLGSNGGTYVQYGIEMANKIFAANPLEEGSDRVRVMVMFTDGLPGIGTFDETVANEAIANAYITKNTHNAYVYTVGLYPSDGVDALDDEAVYMNAVSSNYPNAQQMSDVMAEAGYIAAPDGSLNDGNTYYALRNNSYYEIKYGSVRVSGSWVRQTCWYYTAGWTSYKVSSTANPTISDGAVDGTNVYIYREKAYLETPNSGYYSTTDSEQMLKEYFANIMQEITTKITKEIILHEDTILRDIMGQGLVLTPGTVITAYKVAGSYSADGIVWAEEKQQVAQVTVGENPDKVLCSPETTTISYTLDDGTVVTKDNVPYISVYNLQAGNATNPDAPDYHPHAVDITGYDFENWYISDQHPEGYKMVVEITRVEATDDVQWGRSTTTNHAQSGLWLPADENGARELLLAFDQPSTIFVERAYVLDYAKQFTLSGWYFDDADGKQAAPIHVDCDVQNGMNWFDEQSPNTANSQQGDYGNTSFGNVQIADGEITYTPTSMNWGGYDQFYVFGNTWRKTVLAQDANENGNLWNKVTVIPANNIYYEDSFVTTQDTEQNGITGFTFTGSWSVTDSENAGQNVENPEHLEDETYGDVHGWTDGLGDDSTFTDGSAHVTDALGASVEFTFTGTGVDVYTRTNAKSGMVVAVLTYHAPQDDGSVVKQVVKSFAMDNVSYSGDYYHIPTVFFKDLVYGTYTLRLIATAAGTNEAKRQQYYIDGVRVYNPLGATTNYLNASIQDAYGLENNAVFTQVRDILLDYGDFNLDMPDGTDGKLGAVFIDRIQEGETSGNDSAGDGVGSYELGSFEAYGPKNEVYLSKGQAIVLKVDEANTYYLGLKSLMGDAVTANVSGIDMQAPTQITLRHTTDMYYRVQPVDGYIVIQNGSDNGAVLSITNLRTTNSTAPAANGGVLNLNATEAVEAVSVFAQRMLSANTQKPSQEETKTPAQLAAEENNRLAQKLFDAVKAWMKGDEQA